MRRGIFLVYKLLTWLILLVLFLAIFSFTLLDSPATFFSLLKTPLKEYGVKYGKMEGSFLTGFTLSDLNYKEQVKAKKIAVKVDFHALQNRLLYVENVMVEKLEIEEGFLNSLMQEKNTTDTPKGESNISLPFDFVIVDNVDITLLNLNYDEYVLKGAKLHIDNFKSDLKEQHKGSVELMLDSNVVQAKLDAKMINEAYVLSAKIKGEQSFINKFLEDKNVTITKKPNIELLINGDMEALNYEIEVKALALKQNAYRLNSKVLNLKGYYNLETQKLKAKLITDINSNVARFTIDGNMKLNFNDVNNSLNFKVNSKLKLDTQYVNKFLNDSNVTLSGETPLEISAKGDMNLLKVKLLASSQLLTQGILSAVKLESKEIELNLKKHSIKGALFLDSDAKNIALNLKSNFSGDYTKVEKLKTNTQLNLLRFNAFSVNLDSLTPLRFKVNNNQNGTLLEVDSKKIKLEAKSSDFNSIGFALNTKNIYPNKIVELPVELEKKFVKFNMNGSVNVKKSYLTLKGELGSNKGFKVDIDAVNNVNGLRAFIRSKELKVKASGNLENKMITASVHVASLKKLQEEFALLYDFGSVPIDGTVEINAKLKGEEVFATLKSPKLKFEGLDVEKIDIDAHYLKALLTLNRLSFKTTGFKKASLNQNYYLNKKAYVHLGEKREVLIDLHPKILIKATGDTENLKATVQVEALPLGHPTYGDVVLSCDLDYIQTLEKKNIVGGVFLDKLKLFYESKYLDPSIDNDVVILTKKDKNKKPTKDSFLEDTAVDIAIYATEANYKTRDIDLKLSINIKAKKEFGKTLRMLGKVEDIAGRVEQSPKFFTVINSNIVFQGRKEVNPLLDLKVEHVLPDILITINIHGNAKRPKLTFTSEPPLPKKDILSYLLLGVSTGGLGKGKSSLGREAQLFIMNQAARDLAHEVELDRVFIKDDGTGEGYATQVGKKISENTMFVIENSKEGNSFILEYDVSKNIKVEVGQHQKTVPSQSIDIYYRKRFK